MSKNEGFINVEIKMVTAELIICNTIYPMLMPEIAHDIKDNSERTVYKRRWSEATTLALRQSVGPGKFH